MTASESLAEDLTEYRVGEALLAVQKINDVLGYIIRDVQNGSVQTLAECLRTLAKEAAEHLDRPWPKGGAS